MCRFLLKVESASTSNPCVFYLNQKAETCRECCVFRLLRR
uniref:Uncharacterized protein n=1 Tax=Aegilops tauschii subsp. strangulata TaxID=200361 RepID=A0A453EAH9_AEGTS